ncbi:MAG: ferritin family protein [bacterium]
MKTLKDVIGMALETEKEGARFYHETAQKASNPLVKATFEFLAGEEQTHVKIFTSYLEKEHLINTNELTHSHIDAKDEIYKIFNTVSEKLISKKARGTDQRTDAYEVGLKIEEKSYNLYKSHIDKVESADAKKFLQFLCDQENSHYKILQESKDFLDNPGDWFQKEERWMQT